MILTVGSIAGLLKVISDQSKDIDTHLTHISPTHTNAHTDTSAGQIGVQTMNRGAEAVHTDNPPFCW